MSFDSEEEKDKGPPKVSVAQIVLLISQLDSDEGGSTSQPSIPLVTTGKGLPVLPNSKSAGQQIHPFRRATSSKGQEQTYTRPIHERPDYHGPGS